MLAGCRVIIIHVNIRLLQHSPRDAYSYSHFRFMVHPTFGLPPDIIPFFFFFFFFLPERTWKKWKGWSISPGENIPSDEEQGKTRQQESWDFHFHTLCDE